MHIAPAVHMEDIVPLKDLIPDDWKLELIDLYDAGTGSDDDDEQKTHINWRYINW